MKKIFRLDALVSMRERARAIPRLVVSILLGEIYILTHYLVKMLAKYCYFSLNVSFCRMPPRKVNHDIILRFMTSQYATSRKWVLHVNGSPTRIVITLFYYRKWGFGGIKFISVHIDIRNTIGFREHDLFCSVIVGVGAWLVVWLMGDTGSCV